MSDLFPTQPVRVPEKVQVLAPDFVAHGVISATGLGTVKISYFHPVEKKTRVDWFHAIGPRAGIRLGDSVEQYRYVAA